MIEIKLDPWQKEFIDTEGDKILNTGRQVGKSVILSIDAGSWAMKHPNKVILMIAPTERQAFALFEKTLDYVYSKEPRMIMKGKDRPTRTKINLSNKTRIWCLPTGVAGLGIRFLTVDRLYPDEASRICDEVWSAVTPMMLVTGGATILSSTPAGHGGYFADCWVNKDNAFNSFTRFSISSEECIKKRKICDTWTVHQRDKALEHLARERARMTALQYAQEYEGQLVDSLRQFFSDDLIRSCFMARGDSSFCSPSSILTSSSCHNFLGVDVAGMGSDETVLFSLAMAKNKHLYEIDKQVTTKERTTATVANIKIADMKHNYKKIYIDDGGMGVGVFDPLLIDPQTKRKVVGINNSSRSIDKDGRKRKLLKEDLYNSLLNLMENGKLSLVESDDTFMSLKSVQAEYTGDGKLKIFGRYTHITEALIRAAWGVREKGLNIWIA